MFCKVFRGCFFEYLIGMLYTCDPPTMTELGRTVLDGGGLLMATPPSLVVVH
jgi:hypothetical protein